MKTQPHAAAQACWPQPVQHVLGPGDVCLAREGDSLQTLLGSCVSIILFDPARTLAVMCHIVHAGQDRSGRRDCAHAGPAWQALCGLLRGQGLEPGFCQAFLYGGANMFPSLSSSAQVGAANIDWARQILRREGIAVLDEDVGGQSYRRLSWRVGPGLPQLIHGHWIEGQT